jgi:hypothetical protein
VTLPDRSVPTLPATRPLVGEMTDDPTYTLTLAASDVKFLRKLVRTEIKRHRRSAPKLIEKFGGTDRERLAGREAFMLNLYALLGGDKVA